MSNQTLTVNGPKTIRQQLESEQFRQAVAKALPKHLAPDRFIRVACTTVMRTPKLANCDQTSFFNALLTLSQLGIEADGRRAHLIPFENRKRNVTEVQLIIDYKGLAELAMRSGIVSFLHADVVCDNDEFDYNAGQLKAHHIDFKKPRGNVYAVYALCRFKDGSEKCDVMTRDEVEEIRKRSRAGTNGPWVTDWNEMAKKTVFRRLSKWLPLSPEFRDAVEADEEDALPAHSVRVETGALVAVAGSFELPESDREQGQNADEPEEAESGVAPARNITPAKAPQPAIAQTDLQELIIAAGHDYATLQRFGEQTGSWPDASSFPDFASMPKDVAERLARLFRGKSKATMWAQMEELKGVAA